MKALHGVGACPASKALLPDFDLLPSTGEGGITGLVEDGKPVFGGIVAAVAAGECGRDTSRISPVVGSVVEEDDVDFTVGMIEIEKCGKLLPELCVQFVERLYDVLNICITGIAEDAVVVALSDTQGRELVEE